MSYPLLAPSDRIEETRAAIAAADTDDGEAPPSRKLGWEPPPPAGRR